MSSDLDSDNDARATAATPPTEAEYRAYSQVLVKEHAEPKGASPITSLDQLRQVLYTHTSAIVSPGHARSLVQNVMHHVELVWEAMPKRHRAMTWPDVLKLYNLVDHRWVSLVKPY